MATITETEAYRRLTTYLARAEHCRAEVVLKMQRWGLDRATITRTVQRLEEERYIDDERYCRAFVNDRFRFDRWGKQKIALALQAKKIGAATYRPYLDAIPEEDYLDTLSALLRAKGRSLGAATDFDRRMKLIRFALSRGYERDCILHCLDKKDDTTFEP